MAVAQLAGQCGRLFAASTSTSDSGVPVVRISLPLSSQNARGEDAKTVASDDALWIRETQA